MRDLRIVFMGTPEFAVASLARLVEAKYTIAGVITSPDRPAGRGQKIRESAVKKYALQKGLPILQPVNLKEAVFLKELADLNANLQIVVAFRMLPRAVWQMPAYGTFNLHASLLPNYRGAAPINWAVINGEAESGVTTFFIDEKMDTGAIILQDKVAIAPEDTAGMLHDKLMVCGADLVLKTVIQIEEDTATTQVQENQPGQRPAPKIDKATCKIDWDRPGEDIYNHIRGLSPYPAAWTHLVNAGETLLLKVFASKFEKEKHLLENGAVRHDRTAMKVAVHGGFICLEEIQLAGKRRMHTSELLNGLNLSKSAHMA